MLAEMFYWLLNASIIGGLVGLAVMLLRKIKRLPRFAVYLLWLLPLVRLWIPAGFTSRFSLLQLLSGFAMKTVALGKAVSFLPEMAIANCVMAADWYFPLRYKTDLLEQIFTVASLIWLIIAAAAVLAAILLYGFTKSELKGAVQLSGNVYTSDKITSPAVFGVLKPRIVLPAVLAEGEITHILQHERVHIRRRDNLWRIVAVATACVHWFNPLVWIFLRAFLADMELACDARVIKRLDSEQRKAYAAALLSAAQGKAFFSSAFGSAKTKVRITNILSYKKLTRFSALCFAVLLVIVTVVLMTNASV